MDQKSEQVKKAQEQRIIALMQQAYELDLRAQKVKGSDRDRYKGLAASFRHLAMDEERKLQNLERSVAAGG